MKKFLTISFLAFLALNSAALAEFNVPELKNPVNDYANVLTDSGKEKVSSEIIQLKNDTGSQMGVLIVDSLNGDSIEEASMKTARQWKLGTQGKDNGILLLIAVKDHKMRLEVGYGLEKTLTDSRARRVTGKMRGFLKSNNYDGAVSYAVSKISLVLKSDKGETVVASPTPSSSHALMIFLIVIGILGALIFIGYIMDRSASKTNKKKPKSSSKSHGHSDRQSVHESKDSDSLSSAALGFLAGSMSSGSSSSDDSSSSSSSSDSDWGGGGGDFGGGGSSDSW